MNLDYAQQELQRRRKQLPERQPVQIDEIAKLFKQPKALKGSDETKQSYAVKPRQITRLDDLDTSHPLVNRAVNKAREWAERKRSGVDDASYVLCGPVGTGKTHIARSILWSIRYDLGDGTPIAPAGKFFHASDLILGMSPTKNDNGLSESPRPIQFIGNVPILVIDDVGSEQKIPFIGKDDQLAEMQARYFSVINYCYHRLSLIITSNLEPHELEAHLGPRSWDRLSEMAPAGFIGSLKSVPSWRQKQSGR